MLLREVPFWERPREKAETFGIKSLSTTELIAILLNTGTKDQSVMALASQVLACLDSLSDLEAMTYEELTSIKGIGKAKATTILAALELSLRVRTQNPSRVTFHDPAEVYAYFKDEMQGLWREQLIAVYVNSKGKFLGRREISQGSNNSTVIDYKEIIRWALKLSAPAFLLVHNHPSKDPTPSQNDIECTKRIINLAKEMNLVLIDHVVIGDGYYSIMNDIKNNSSPKPSKR